LPEKKTITRGPKQNPPGRLSGHFRINLKKLLPVGREKRSIPKTVETVCCIYEAKYFENSVLLYFKKDLVLRNTTQ